MGLSVKGGWGTDARQPLDVAMEHGRVACGVVCIEIVQGGVPLVDSCWNEETQLFIATNLLLVEQHYFHTWALVGACLRLELPWTMLVDNGFDLQHSHVGCWLPCLHR